MSTQETYNILCIADENYAQHAAVMLCSLLETNRDKRFRVFLMTYTLQDRTKKLLHEVVESRGAELTIIEDRYENVGLESLKCDTGVKAWNPIMYLKLLIPQYVPQDVDRFLFLDVDIVVNHDIGELYHIDLQGHLMAACEDYEFCGVHKSRLGFPDDELYVNSGVMVVDLQAWREKLQTQPMFEFLQERKDIIHDDQDAFALYFRGQIILLPTNQWNATTFFFERRPRILPKYLPEVEKVRQAPYIIHFCEPIKPWFRECKHPYGKLYRQYLRMTPWKHYRFPSCCTVYGKSVWQYTVKYWLNVMGLRYDEMMMIRL